MKQRNAIIIPVSCRRVRYRVGKEGLEACEGRLDTSSDPAVESLACPASSTYMYSSERSACASRTYLAIIG